MNGLLQKEVRVKRTSGIAYCLTIFGFTLLYTSIFPTFQKQSESFGKIFESLPKSFTESFGVGLNTFSDIQHFLSVELFTIVWPLTAILLVVSTMGSSLAGEIEKGTMGTLLSLPLGRPKVYWTKFLVGVILILAFITCSLFAAMPLASLFGLSYAAKGFLLTAAMGFAFMLCMYSFTAFAASVFSEKSRVYGVVGGVLMLMYVANMVSSLVDSLSFLRYGSLFYYFSARQTIATNMIDMRNFLVLLIPALIFMVLGFIVFRKKDLTV